MRRLDASSSVGNEGYLLASHCRNVVELGLLQLCGRNLAHVLHNWVRHIVWLHQVVAVVASGWSESRAIGKGERSCSAKAQIAADCRLYLH